MFPPTRGELSNSAAGPRGITSDGKVSALVGDHADSAAQAAPSGRVLSDEELKVKANGLIVEFVITMDAKEVGI